MRLSSVDLPAFGGPAMATTSPSRSRSPRPPSASAAHDLVVQRARRRERRAHEVLGHIGLVGKIDAGLDQRQRLDQPPPPRLGTVADQALELTKRLAALRRRLGRDQVRQALDRGEIELAVLERTARELARLGRPQALDATERIEHARNDSLAAVHLQLGHVLAGLAARPRKPQRQRLIDDLARLRIAHPRERGLARRGQAADQRLQAPRPRAGRRCG